MMNIIYQGISDKGAKDWFGANSLYIYVTTDIIRSIPSTVWFTLQMFEERAHPFWENKKLLTRLLHLYTCIIVRQP